MTPEDATKLDVLRDRLYRYVSDPSVGEDADKAKATFEKAYSLATAHNPPSAFVRPNARKKIGGAK